MPTVTREQVQGFKWCGHVSAERGLCPGVEQRPAQLIRTHTSYSYRDHGGDLPGEESSVDYYLIADEAERVCEHCGSNLECAVQERPVYMNLSRVAQDGLVGLIQDGKRRAPGDVGGPRDAERDESVADLQRQLAEQRRQIADLMADKAGKPARKTADEPA